MTGGNLPAVPLKLADIVEEYNIKVANAESVVEDFGLAVSNVNACATVQGTFAETVFDRTPYLHVTDVTKNLLLSAWRHVYTILRIDEIAPASDRARFARDLQKPPEFTYDNVKATFADYLLAPRYNILRGLAEVFTELDPAYKSHSRCRIGVKGLPKRVIFPCGVYNTRGRQRLLDILRAVCLVRGRSTPDHAVVGEIVHGRLTSWEGFGFTTYKNGNLHVSFDHPTLVEINKALNEFYGEGLFDESVDGDKPSSKMASSVPSKDLAYYPTPKEVVERLVSGYVISGKVLEPSCGCGRILDGLKKEHCKAFGIEINPVHANVARGKGHTVEVANFLTTVPDPSFDHVVMNPPFAGKHWLKHIDHAMKFLKDGGSLISILPASAWYDRPSSLFTEGAKHVRWVDLPVGSFSESGTNVCTGILFLRKSA